MIFSYKLFQLKKRGSINKSPRNFQIKIGKRDVSSAKLFLDSLGMRNIVFFEIFVYAMEYIFFTERNQGKINRKKTRQALSPLRKLRFISLVSKYTLLWRLRMNSHSFHLLLLLLHCQLLRK